MAGDSITCSRCGRANLSTHQFCAHCGAPLKKADPALDAENTLAGAYGHASSLDSGLTTYIPCVGGVIAERYELRAELGRGGMGVVWRAFDRQLEMEVALKLLPEVLANDPLAIARLKTEARTAMQLSHANIVRLYQFDQAECGPFLTMELLPGPTLAGYLAARLAEGKGPAPVEEVISWGTQACAALEYAHAQGVVHRDMKPHNLMRAADGTLKLTDFGIARVVSDSVTTLTGNVTVGTLTYMSPEQLLGHEVGPASDIYSLGITLYELAAGKPPFASGDITFQHQHEPPRPLTGDASRLNPAIMRALAKTPEQRWKSAAEFSRELRGSSGTRRVAPVEPPVRPPRRIPRPYRIPRYKWIIIGLAFVLWGPVKRACNSITEVVQSVREVPQVQLREEPTPAATEPSVRTPPPPRDSSRGSVVPPKTQMPPARDTAAAQPPRAQRGPHGATPRPKTPSPFETGPIAAGEDSHLVVQGDTLLVSDYVRRTMLNPAWWTQATKEERAAALDSARNQLLERLKKRRRP